MTDKTNELPELKPLSKKHAQFVAEYLKDFNGTKAYMRVYQDSSIDAARADASRLLTYANISKAIDEQRNLVLMQADEAMLLMSGIASMDMGEVLTEDVDGEIRIDMAKARDKKYTKFFKKIRTRRKVDKDGNEEYSTDFELLDPQTAQRDILKIHGKFIDRTDVTSKGNRIENAVVNIYLPSNNRE